MATYTDVNEPLGVLGTSVDFISADGTTVAGSYTDSGGDDDGFVQDLASGMFTVVRDPHGLHTTVIRGITGDGSLVAGTYIDSSGLAVGFVDNILTGVYTDILEANAVSGTVVSNISNDGSTVAGNYDDGSVTKSFVENLNTHLVFDIDAPDTNTGTFINAISADGGIVGGYYQSSNGPEGYVLNLATNVFTEVAAPNAASGSVVQFLSGDGNQAAGYYLSSTRGYVGFVEDLTTKTYRDVYDPKATSGTQISAISADGSTLVGNYFNTDGEFGFVENLATGVYTDLNDPNGVQGTLANAVSGDGSLVGGIYGDVNDDTIGYVASGVACYGRGTSILTVSGEVAIEDLAIGDLVVTATGEAKPILWIGHRMVDCARHPERSVVWPIRISAGAFGEYLPRRDLWMSPGHNVAFEGGLIEAQRLINGRSVVQVERDRIEYWHIELDAHDVILAEGLAAETYLDTGNRTAFANGGAFVEAHPDFRPKHWAQTCLPLVFDGAPLLRARTQLLTRLASLGFETTAEADLHILADGARIAPMRLGASRFAFVLPGTCARVRLASRSFVPAETLAESEDFRVLGLCIGRLQIDGDEIALDNSARFTSGWHACEPGQRWTDGGAELPSEARLVVIHLVGEGRYWRETPEVKALARRA